MKKPGIEIERHEFAKMDRVLADHFFEITRQYYSRTPTGYEAKHNLRYWWLKSNEPLSKVYFMKVNGVPIASALVLHKSQRWYSLAVHDERLKEQISDKQERARALGDAMTRLADEIIQDYPKAWGTVSADNQKRIDFFTNLHWKLVEDPKKVVAQFSEMEPKWNYLEQHFNIKKVDEPEPQVRFTRLTATNGPIYEQVLLVPKKTARRKAAGKK